MADLSTLLAAIIPALAAVAASVRWIAGVAGKVKSLESEDEKHSDAVRDMRQTIQSQTRRIDDMEKHRAADIERIVKLEVVVAAFEKSIERLSIDLKDTRSELLAVLNDRFDQLLRR